MQTGGDAPAQVAAVALGLGVGAIRSIEPIKHGLTNRSWLVTTEADRVVVRISHRSEADLLIDRAQRGCGAAAGRAGRHRS